jgi:hypothetical protein
VRQSFDRQSALSSQHSIAEIDVVIVRAWAKLSGSLRKPFAEFLLTTLRRGRGAKPDSEKLRDLRDRYREILDGQTFKRVRDLRHNAIAHLLVSEEPPATVEYADIFALAYEIERQVIALYEGLGIRPPQFASFKEDTAERAKLFWQTYFAGVAGLA